MEVFLFGGTPLRFSRICRRCRFLVEEKGRKEDGIEDKRAMRMQEVAKNIRMGLWSCEPVSN